MNKLITSSTDEKTDEIDEILQDAENIILASNGDTKKHIRNKGLIIFAIVIAILAILLLAFSTVFALININSNKIMNGVFIQGIDVSGLTTDEAKEKVSNIVNKHFDEFEPSKLSDDISMIDSLISKLPELILENSDVEERRKNEIKKREEAEEREKLLDEEYLSKEYDIDEDLNGITIMNRIIRAIKTFEIFGQVIKKNWGAFDGDVKDSYVLMTFNLSMRILSAYFNFIEV